MHEGSIDSKDVSNKTGLKELRTLVAWYIGVFADNSREWKESTSMT